MWYTVYEYKIDACFTGEHIKAKPVEGKIIRCPKCGSKEYMEPEKDVK